ncbi:MAG: phosphoribosylformylglycinamidine synthase subunit PurQ [Clostridia bacterium]|nr:MAG: phosphoribosylformylglycinamidine synthase subunit PurQ [Clostridia bacterium]
MRFAVVVFPGSNCDADVLHVVQQVLGQEGRFVWHREEDLSGFDCVVLPGGFSYGDYLRPGAIARFSPVMRAVTAFAAAGGLVLGICNGFQVLLEAGLLPGAMLVNDSVQFRCLETWLRVENAATPFTVACRPGQVLRVPVAHHEGNYYADPATLAELEAQAQVVLRYVNQNGEETPEANPNGSARNIAGIINRYGNVLGLMPHPERCAEPILGNTDGRYLWNSLLSWVQQGGGRVV